MPLDLDQNTSRYQIRSYRPGELQINDQTYHQSLIVTPDTLIENWQAHTSNEITQDSLSKILELKPDILLIGTGGEHHFLDIDIYGDLINHGIGVEVMSTGAACRTFNALSAEHRKVVAALIV